MILSVSGFGFKTRHAVSKTHKRYPHFPIDYMALEWAEINFRLPCMCISTHCVHWSYKFYWMVWEEMLLQNMGTDGQSIYITYDYFFLNKKIKFSVILPGPLIHVEELDCILKMFCWLMYLTRLSLIDYKNETRIAECCRKTTLYVWYRETFVKRRTFGII